MINSDDHLTRRNVTLVGHRMSVVDEGLGLPVLFLHGNVTSSYVWRNIIPFVSVEHRCLAPDLMGMGKSELLTPSGSGSYGFDIHMEYLEALLEVLSVTGPLVIVGHEMGAAFGVELAQRHPDMVSGLVLIEGVLRVTNDDTLDPNLVDLMHEVRGEDGEHLVLNQNLLVEHYLPALTLRPLSEAEMEAYRAPFHKVGESRRAMLAMMRQLPLRSDPGPIAERIDISRRWCSETRIPKLVIGGKPGFLIPPPILGTTARWRATDVVSVDGLHFLMEDSPARISAALIDWLAQIGHTSRARAVRG